MRLDLDYLYLKRFYQLLHLVDHFQYFLQNRISMILHLLLFMQ